MPSQLAKNDKVSFVVAKPFVSRGKEYNVGDDFPQEEARDIETFVRARFLIPVVDSIEDKATIRHWHRHIRPKDEVLERLRHDRVQLRMPTPPDSMNMEEFAGTTGVPVESEAEQTEAEVEQQEQAEAAAEAVHTETYDPSYHTVAEVNAYLAIHPEEREDVLAAEESGKARKGILEA